MYLSTFRCDISKDTGQFPKFHSYLEICFERLEGLKEDHVKETRNLLEIQIIKFHNLERASLTIECPFQVNQCQKEDNKYCSSEQYILSTQLKIPREWTKWHHALTFQT